MWRPTPRGASTRAGSRGTTWRFEHGDNGEDVVLRDGGVRQRAEIARDAASLRRVEQAEVERALASCAMPVLQHLTLERAQLVEGAPFLLRSRNLATVQTLSITWDQLIDDGAVALGVSPHPRALREVSFARSNIETKSVIAL